MQKRIYTLSDYLKYKLEKHVPSMACKAKTATEFAGWKAAFIEKLKTSLATPMPEPVPLNPEVLMNIELPGIRAQKIVFDSSAGMSVAAWILIPAKGTREKLPAVCVVPGHTGDNVGPHGRIVDQNSGKAWVVGLNPDGSACSTRYHNDIGQELCRAGYVVFCQDFLGFGERADDPKYMRNLWTHVCNNVALGLKLFNDFEITAVHLHDMNRGMDYLLSRPEVDASRIGIAGCSLGGMWASWLGSIDERIKAIVASCSYPNLRYRAIGKKFGFCDSGMIPGQMNWCEEGDVLAAIAPKPLMVQAGKADTGMPSELIVESCGEAQRIYQILGAADRFAIDIFDGGHGINTRMAVEWFKKWL